VFRMATRFDHEHIEKKWQAQWEASKIYETGTRDESREKKFILTEFPYPSGNLHIGHWYAFAVPDIYVRKLRMEGKQVMYPIGFDSFGLPAENAAIKRKLDPKAWTYDNIAYMTNQLKSMGNAFDWSRLVITSNPDYYRFTQWIFTELFNNDLIYRGVGTVNWCPSCNTVLANEQVVDGTCERCGSTVEQREMPEWKMRITKYADRLIDDLDSLSWPEFIKDLQRNWIGRSNGAEIDFTLSTGDTLTVFTTRADTLYGATFCVMAPEHPLLATLKSHITNWDEVVSYQKKTAEKDEIERTNDTKEKTGVKLEGVTATNPATGEALPVFIADYILARYGTGAIMAVPAHDARDSAFAVKYQLPVRTVITDDATLINSGAHTGTTSTEAIRAITAQCGGRMKSTYRLRDWSVGRQRYWGVPIPIVYDPEGGAHPVPAEHLPWLLPTDVDVTPTGEPPLAKSAELKERTERIFGKGWTPEVETMDTFVDSSWYFLRYTDPKNASSLADMVKQKEWLPVDVYFGGSEHTTMHLLYSRFVQKALYDLGHTPVSEPYAVRYNRGLVLGPDGAKMSKSKGNVIDPDEQVARLGADTVKMYLAFMGPYGTPTNYPWDLGGIAGIRRFLERVYDLKGKIHTGEHAGTTTLIHQTIAKVTSDIDALKFNTAISALMVFVNAAEKEGLKADEYELFLRLLAPFAPHLTEELWHQAGKTESIHHEAWPVADASLLTVTSVTIAVQINGKPRETISLPPDATEEEALARARANEGIAKRLESRTIAKVIYVKGRALNLIVPDGGA
jgi:leucyl-tRNA synthetase